MLNANIPRLRLACEIPNPSDGTSFYRAMGPLGAMQREEPRLELVHPRANPGGGLDLSWDWLQSCHMVFMQRPYLPVHVAFARQCKDMGLPLWVDWDDDLACLRKANPHYGETGDPARANACMRAVVELADVVSVSTEELADRYGRKCRVIPNALQHALYGERRQRRVAWRGSASHDEDIACCYEAVRSLSRLPQFSMWSWMFMGEPPWEVEGLVPAPRLELHAGGPMTSWVHTLAQYAPYVLIVPLHNNRFNKAKSNLAWIEATAVGAITLAPDWPEWQRPGVVHYKTMEDFEAKLRGLMNDYSPDLPLQVKESRAFISEHLTLRTVNKDRWQLLEELWDRRTYAY